MWTHNPTQATGSVLLNWNQAQYAIVNSPIFVYFHKRVTLYRVWYINSWLENVPVGEALVYEEEGYSVQRMDLPI